MQYTTPTASHVTGSTLAAGAATVTTLQVANKQVKVSIERVTITADCVEGKSQPQILHDETNVPHKAKRKTGKADDLSAPAS